MLTYGTYDSDFPPKGHSCFDAILHLQHFASRLNYMKKLLVMVICTICMQIIPPPVYAESFHSFSVSYARSNMEWKCGYGEYYKSEDSVNFIGFGLSHSVYLKKWSQTGLALSSALSIRFPISGTHLTTDLDSGESMEYGALTVHKIPLEVDLSIGPAFTTDLRRRGGFTFSVMPTVSYALYNQGQPNNEVIFGIKEEAGVSFRTDSESATMLSFSLQEDFVDIVFGQAKERKGEVNVLKGFSRLTFSPSLSFLFGL